MKIQDAVQQIKFCAEQMNANYKKVVFDEWAVISVADKRARLMAYLGPRKAGFQKNFLADAGSLKQSLLTQDWNEGDFEFARNGVGTNFESVMSVGKGFFLICN